MSLPTSPRQNKPPSPIPLMPPPPHITAFSCSFGEEPPEENRVHLGHAIMSFYAALIDLLGRCAPEMHVRPEAWAGAWGMASLEPLHSDIQ